MDTPIELVVLNRNEKSRKFFCFYEGVVTRGLLDEEKAEKSCTPSRKSM